MAEKLAMHGGKRTVPQGFINPWPEITEADRQAVMEVLSVASIQEQQNIQAQGLAKEWAEYMGMKFHKDEKTGRNYYIKDDFYLANIENNDWYAFSQSFEPVKIVIENMLMGYHILRSLGMKIEIDEILNAE